MLLGFEVGARGVEVAGEPKGALNVTKTDDGVMPGVTYDVMLGTQRRDHRRESLES